MSRHNEAALADRILQDLAKQAQLKVTAAVEHALQLLDEPTQERHLVLSIAIGVIGGTVGTLARPDMPHPKFRALPDPLKIRLVLTLIQSVLGGPDQNDGGVEAEEVAAMIAACAEITPYPIVTPLRSWNRRKARYEDTA